jgi:uncharacterized membrane protein
MCGTIPGEITGTIGQVYNILLIAIPVLVVIFGLVDFLKGVIGKKDDEISNSAKLFNKRVIIGAIAFFALALVKFGISLLATNNTSNIANCLDEIFGNNQSNG